MDMDVADGCDQKAFQKFVFCRGDIPALEKKNVQVLTWLSG